MKYTDLNNSLLEHFPELEERAREEFRWWSPEPPPSHVFYGDVLTPFVKQQLSTMAEPKLLDRIFQFLEAMAMSGQDEVKAVLTDSILEVIGDDRELLARARALMGRETLALSHVTEKQWGRE
ncbi:MAG: hypothetical protein HY681_05825 [Chloroflexi bacterium]|nr:hypothetical protein [Chloroflexota bacterium]